jgi:Ca2+-binding RTX toxin-like protein
VVNGAGLSTRPDLFSNPLIDFTRGQGLTVLDLDHLGTGPVTAGLQFVDYNDRITDANLLRVFRWALESGSTPQVAPVFFGTPYTLIPRFVRMVPGVASAANTGYRDWVLGSAGDDVIDTGPADDLIAGGAGNDVIDGGPGSNAALYLGERSRFDTRTTGDTTLVSDRGGREGTDALTNVQLLQFADQRVAIGGCTRPPSAPWGVVGAVVSGVASVHWSEVPGAGSYVLAAGTSPGIDDLFNGTVGGNLTLSAGVAKGFRAYVRVWAVNACGRSGPSQEILVQ